MSDRHFEESVWIDYIRGLHEDDAVASHLASGCEACRKAHEIWTRIADTARRERDYEPPEEVVRAVKAAFAARHQASILLLLAKLSKRDAPAISNDSASPYIFAVPFSS
jgi:hypothetical protein